MNINPNAKKKQRSKKGDKNTSQIKPGDYLNYGLPKPKKDSPNAKAYKSIKMRLDVCRQQLLLKDVVMYPENLSEKFPQIAMMTDMLFLYRGVIAYFDGNTLDFVSLHDDWNAACQFVKDLTGWDLLDDILMPSAEKYYYNGSERKMAIEDTAKRPFIITSDFVWEIWEVDGRVVYEDDVIQERLETIEDEIAVSRFYPQEPITDNEYFTKEQLARYARFLDQEVKEHLLSYQDFKHRYGVHIRNEKGQKISENGGFYKDLGIGQDSKFKKYLQKYHGLTFESVREGPLYPGRQGIWYSPNTNHYIVGSKDAIQTEQERGDVLRKIVVHQGNDEINTLNETLSERFFPMLEVNFIRHSELYSNPISV